MAFPPPQNPAPVNGFGRPVPAAGEAAAAPRAFPAAPAARPGGGDFSFGGPRAAPAAGGFSFGGRAAAAPSGGAAPGAGAAAPAAGSFSFGGPIWAAAIETMAAAAAAPAAPGPPSFGGDAPYPPPVASASDSDPQATTTSPGDLSSDLLKGLGNDDLTDIVLIGSDGGRVPAFRKILAVRSKVFERMLYGDFREGASSEVAVDYNSDVLRAVVEFCCSDSIKGWLDAKIANEAVVRKLVQICAAAHFFDMPKLATVADMELKFLLNDGFHLCCVVYDEVGADASTEQLKLFAKEKIALQPEASLLKKVVVFGRILPGGGVESLGPLSLQELMKDEALAMLEAKTMFHALKMWLEKGTDADEAESRKEVAKEIASLTNLADIEPVDLLGVVLESGLVEKDQILEAVKEQVNEDAVHVRGAGTREVNGRYKREGEHSGGPRYCKQGRWEGRNVLFCLYRIRLVDGSHTWRISIPPPTNALGISTTHFYSAQDSGRLPDGNWQSMGAGRDPAPSCHSYMRF